MSVDIGSHRGGAPVPMPGMVSQANATIPGKVSHPSAASSSLEQDAEHYRLGILYFLSRSQTGVPADADLVNNCIDTSNDTHNMVATGKSRLKFWKKKSWQGNSEGGFLDSIVEVLVGYLKKLAGYFKFDDLAKSALNEIVKVLPEIVVKPWEALCKICRTPSICSRA